LTFNKEFLDKFKRLLGFGHFHGSSGGSQFHTQYPNTVNYLTTVIRGRQQVWQQRPHAQITYDWRQPLDFLAQYPFMDTHDFSTTIISKQKTPKPNIYHWNLMAAMLIQVLKLTESSTIVKSM
jgi:hypothetical protein